MYIDLNVAIEKRKNFDATNRETIFVQNIDFFDVAIDKNSDKNIEKINDTFSERSRIIFDINIEKNKNFDDEKNDETKKIKNKTIDFEICKKNETIVFDFFAWRIRICFWNLILLSNFVLFLQRRQIYFSIRFLIKRISFCCFNNFFVFCLILFFICNSCLRTRYFFCIFLTWMNQTHFWLIWFCWCCSYKNRKFCFVIESSTKMQMQRKNDQKKIKCEFENERCEIRKENTNRHIDWIKFA